MDKLDKILLEHLPDTGLCQRGKARQADRRKALRKDIVRWLYDLPPLDKNKGQEAVIIDELHLKI